MRRVARLAIHEDGDLLVADDEGHISKLKKDAMDTGTRPLGPLGPGQTGPGCEMHVSIYIYIYKI